MPKLQAFGRVWRVGSDDVALPAALNTLMSFSWGASFVYLIFHCPACFDELPHSRLFTVFTKGGLALTIGQFYLNLATVLTAQRGTLINAAPRKNIPRLLFAQICLDVAAVAINILGTRLAFYSDIACPAGGLSLVQNVVKVSWAVAVSSGVLLMFVFIPVENKKSLEATRSSTLHGAGASSLINWNMSRVSNMESSESLYSVTAKSVLDRCHSVCQIIGIDNQPAIGSIANLIIQYFKEDVDIVPTDIMAAMVLLEQEQLKMKHDSCESLATSSPRYVRYAVQPREWMNIPRARHFMTFACGAYGWPLYVFSRPLATVALLQVAAKARLMPHETPAHVVGDSNLMTNTAVIKMVTGLKNEDIVYVSFENKLFQVPFYIALDHKEKVIVVAIRGTLSLEDVFTDLMAFASDGVPLDDLEDANAHEGMLLSARYIHRRLMGFAGQQQDGSLERTPLMSVAHTQLKALVGQETAKEYGLVILGHSLGGGVASILSLLMRQHPDYRDLQCYAFSPPGGLMSLNAAQYCEDFVCSVVLNDDIVPRLGLVTAYRLKQRIFEILRDCDLPKHQIMGTWLEALIGWNPLGRPANADSPSWADDPAAAKCVERFQAQVQRAIDNSRAVMASQPRMYAAGVVMYIQENKKEYLFSSSSLFHISWLRGNSEMFGEVMLSDNMLSDHKTRSLKGALEQLYNRGITQ